MLMMQHLDHSAEDVTVKLLESGKVDKDFAPGYCTTVLYERIKENDVSMINHLLINRSQLSPSALACVLWYAIAKNCDEIVKVLIKEGADLSQQGIRESFYDYRTNFLTWSIFWVNKSALQLLLDKRFQFKNFEEISGHALHYALVNEKMFALSILLESGVNINYKDEDGNTALHIATHVSKIECYQMILKYNPNVNATNNFGQNALHYAMLGLADCKMAAERLVKLGVAVNGLDIEHETPLHYALALKRSCMAEVLLNNGAKVNAKSKNCIFPLFLSVVSECALKVTLLILKHGANVNERLYNGDTVLHWACKLSLEKEITQLLKFGADVNLKNAEGVLPLSLIKDAKSKSALIENIAQKKQNGMFVSEENMKIIKKNFMSTYFFDHYSEEHKMASEKEII